MQVKELMTTQVVSVPMTASISEVADILHTNGFSGVPVINEAGSVVGIITERELFSSDSKLYLPSYVKMLEETKFAIGGRKDLPYVASQLTRLSAGDIMNHDVYFIGPDEPVEKVAELMAIQQANPVPVTDHQNHLVGIISRTDLVKLLIDNSLPKTITSIHALKQRAIDQELSYVTQDLNSRFAYVAKARANIWLTTAVVLFIVGFVAGIIYVADPSVFTGKTTNPYNQKR